MAACKNKDTDKRLLKRAEQKLFRPSCIANLIQRYSFLEEAPTVYSTGKTSRSTSSRRPVFLEREASDLLRRPSLAFRSVVVISSTLGYVVPTYDATCRGFCSHSTGEMYSSSRLPVANSESSATAALWMGRFCNSHVARMSL